MRIKETYIVYHKLYDEYGDVKIGETFKIVKE
jgi:hypothetical protein